MAGVQIPTLKRIDAPDQASVGRIKADIPDSTREMAQTANAVEKLADVGVDYLQKQDDIAADTEATKRVNEYEVAWKQGIYGDGQTTGAKYSKDDPAKVYAQFDTEMKQKFDSIMGDENLSGRAKQLVAKRLTEKANSLQWQRLSEYGLQQSKYDAGITNAAIDLEKGNLTDAAAADDDFKMLDDTIGRMRQLRFREGLKNGAVQYDEKGQSVIVDDDGKTARVTPNQMVSLTLRKDLSEGIGATAENLIKSGQIDKAKAVLERYHQYLDPVKKKSILDDYRKAEIKQQAFAVADKLKGAGPGGAAAILATVDNPEVKEQALKVADEYDRYMENRKNRLSKNTYDALMNKVNARMRSENPYVGPIDMENDPEIATALRSVTDSRQRQALYHAINQPRETSQASREALQDVLFGRNPDYPDGLKGMDPATFSEFLAGQSKADRNKWNNRYEQANSTTNAQQGANMKLGAKYLKEQMLAAGLLKLDGGTHALTKSSRIDFTEAQDEFLDHMDKVGNSPMNPKELNDWARKFAADRAEGKAFQPPERKRFLGRPSAVTKDDPASPPPNAGPAANNVPIKGKTRMQWAMEFQKVNKRLPDLKTQELQNFIKNQD